MKPLTLLLLLLAPFSLLHAQQSMLPIRPDEIETILELLDAVDAAQAVVLETPERVTDTDIEDLHALVTVAETIGAQDLAARARTLIVLASFGQAAPPPELLSVEEGVNLSPDEPLARDTLAFRRWVNIGATAGATALGMSAVFYYLAERNYQAWLVETDPDAQDQLFRAFRGYDYLGLGLGLATLASVGVGIPLLFAITPPATTLATPPAAATFTAAGRAAELDRLYAERTEIVDKLNQLNARGNRRALATTISLGTGAAGAIAAGMFSYIAEQSYDLYLRAETTTDANLLGRRVSVFDALTVITAGLGGAGFGFAATVNLVTPNRAGLERELEQVNAAIIRVRASRTIDAPDPVPEEPKLSWRERRAAAAEARAAAREARREQAQEAPQDIPEAVPETGE